MSSFLIDLPQTTGRAFRFQAVLSGVLYKFAFEYDVRDSSWYFHVFDAAGAALAMGQRACVNIPLLAQLTDTRKPAGWLMLIDTSNQYQDPGRDDLGSRVKLVYDDLIDG